MYTLKLISEHIEQDTDYLIESKEDGSKSYKIKGIFMQADVKNRNGRVYPMEVLNKEVKRYNKEYITICWGYGYWWCFYSICPRIGYTSNDNVCFIQYINGAFSSYN